MGAAEQADQGVRDAAPTLPRLFLLFARIALTSFGGGLSGWMYRIFVTERGWLSEEEFLNALAVAQALPGVNVANMAIWIGYRLLGLAGALTGLAGILLPGAAAVLAVASLLGLAARWPMTHVLLLGAGAASIGLPLSMALTTARRLPRAPLPLLIAGASFAGVALFNWSVLWVVLVGGAAGVVLAWRAAGAVPR